MNIGEESEVVEVPMPVHPDHLPAEHPAEPLAEPVAPEAVPA